MEEDMALGVAFRAFFAALFNRQSSERIRLALDGDGTGKLTASPKTSSPKSSSSSASSSDTSSESTKPTPRPPAPTRSEALTLLSTLQREARLVDLVYEPLDQFSDQQIGSAAREVLRDSRKTLDRLFAIAPLSDQEEGSTIDIPSNHSPVRLRLVGKADGRKGTVVHRGWKVSTSNLPSWQGDRNDASILAPTEVEVG